MDALLVRRSLYMTLCLACLLANSAMVRRAAAAEPNKIVHLEQGWSDEDRKWFYSVNQGSRLLPYDWFLALEMADGPGLFRDPSHMEELHYLSRPQDATNPDNLPIGFVKDPPRDVNGIAYLGLTCAACHTAQVKIGTTAYRIEGGPGHGDVQTMLRQLAAALEKTHADDTKFAKFADRLHKVGADERTKLRTALKVVADFRQGFNTRNFPDAQPAHAFGFGRIDAFGIILNEVLVTGLKVSNEKNGKTPTAPVSIPFLWDTPLHDKVQWNGSAANRPGNTHFIGPLARNVGEVLGVFGTVSIDQDGKPGYQSSAQVYNLFKIEQRLKKLQSPELPDEFREHDRDVLAAGRKLFVQNCLECHADIVRDDPRRRVKAVMTPIDELKTDPTMANNVATRVAQSGDLQGRPILLLPTETFADVGPARDVLRHVIINAIKRGVLEQLEADTQEEHQKLEKFRSLVKLRNLDPSSLSLRDRLEHLKELIKAAEELKMESLDDLNQLIDLAEAIDGENTGPLDRALEKLDRLYDAAEGETLLAYKGRPLNGIWATAPYLHNGSVPNLDQLLRPAKDRVKTFYVGSREFDPALVGFKSDTKLPGYFEFRVLDEAGQPIPGNSNTGHEYGPVLTDQQRQSLLAYLKSI